MTQIVSTQIRIGLKPIYISILPFWILASLQLIDGILTLRGISIHGHSAEGNPLILDLIKMVGPFYAILICKVFAITLIFTLFQFSEKVLWLSSAIWCLSGIYLVTAVMPWMLILTYLPS